MLCNKLEELYEYLTALFVADLELPTEFDIKYMIYSCVVKKNNPATNIKKFIDFIKVIEENEASILEASEDPFDTYLPEELFNCDTVSCFTFFNMIFDEDYLPNDDDSRLIALRMCYVARHMDVLKGRVEQAIYLLKKARSICENIGEDFLYSIPYVYSHVDKPCDCYDYEMSGDCHHVDDI